MAFRRTEGMSMIQALAMTVAEIPVFLYTTFGQSAFSQLRLTPGLRKVLFATALGTVALALAAHQLKRRRRRKKQVSPEMGGEQLGTLPLPILLARKVPSVKKGYSSRRVQSPSSKSNDTLSGISSIEPSKHSGSSHSLASMVAVNSSSPVAVCSGPWDARGMEESVAASDGNAESLYMQGMELFEEALQKWEQALSVGQRGESASTPIPGDSLQNPEMASEVLSEQESQRREFAEKLESLLRRAYHLQEEFGSTFPSDNMLLDLEKTLMLPLTEGSLHLRADDEDSLTSEDSFFSATELFESLQIGDYPIPLSRPAAAYEEALQLVKEGKVPCRTLRTELLGCYNDQDFLAKLHCVRQAFKGLLEDNSNRLFFGEVGRQMVTGLMTKAEKSPKGFLESYEEMLSYALRPETWATTRLELEGRGVVCMSFFDIVLDFILMDAFEDLENPPSSVLAVLRNRWLSDSFKETVCHCPAPSNTHTHASPHICISLALVIKMGLPFQLDLTAQAPLPLRFGPAVAGQTGHLLQRTFPGDSTALPPYQFRTSVACIFCIVSSRWLILLLLCLVILFKFNASYFFIKLKFGKTTKKKQKSNKL
ncbi:mitoguardin 2 isoform X4 [Elephas maximus indicus]|uniref:mitoguardin 2 isoform X4 n=1 Tax=Elephas maximus indicus TaxID=99487 RepID=UPI002115D5A6|nr:mitoguardin 2 isoform X4 [Elephas maximus indicus]